MKYLLILLLFPFAVDAQGPVLVRYTVDSLTGDRWRLITTVTPAVGDTVSEKSSTEKEFTSRTRARAYVRDFLQVVITTDSIEVDRLTKERTAAVARLAQRKLDRRAVLLRLRNPVPLIPPSSPAVRDAPGKGRKKKN